MRRITENRLERLFKILLQDSGKVYVVERQVGENTVIDISLPVILESTFTVPVQMVEDEPDDETLWFLKYHLLNEAYNTITRYMKEEIFNPDTK